MEVGKDTTVKAIRTRNIIAAAVVCALAASGDARGEGVKE